VIDAVRDKKEAIERLCARYRVARLELFGSAATEGFTENSDVDFLVEFLPLQPGEHADAYFGLLEALEELFQRPVDLVMTGAIKPPYFRRAIEDSRVQLYAA
jgi:predicted nucleotidyltransferase